jgi:hypothetical protein
MRLVEDARVAAYIEGKLGLKLSAPFYAMGFVAEDERPLCGFVFNGFNSANIDITVVAEPGGITLGVLKAVSAYAFDQLQCRRVSARIKKRNKRAIRAAIRFGFVFENVAHRYFNDDDAVVYRMMKEDCRWITPSNPTR